MAAAGSEKVRLEEMQRAERRERDKRSDSWVPRWFRKVEQPKLYDGECYVHVWRVFAFGM